MDLQLYEYNPMAFLNRVKPKSRADRYTGNRIGDNKRDRIIADLKADELTYQQIADKYGCSAGRVWQLKKKEGITRSTRFGKNFKVPAAVTERVEDLLKAGVKGVDIARIVGVSKQFVSKVRTAMNIKTEVFE